jgi:hypothetical protein
MDVNDAQAAPEIARGAVTHNSAARVGMNGAIWDGPHRRR